MLSGHNFEFSCMILGRIVNVVQKTTKNLFRYSEFSSLLKVCRSVAKVGLKRAPDAKKHKLKRSSSVSMSLYYEQSILCLL